MKVLFMTFIFLVQINLFGQTTDQKIVIVNEYEEFYDSYFKTPLFPFFIKPGSFSDGNYLFYLDSAKSIPYFEGSIIDGKPTGNYFLTKNINNGFFDSLLYATIHVDEGNIDGIISLPVLFNNQSLHFSFVKGELIKFQIVNPFEMNIPNNAAFTFNFEYGKIVSVQMENHNDYNFSFNFSDILSDSSGLKQVKEPYYMYLQNKLGYDLTYKKVESLRKFEFEVKNPEQIYLLNHPRNLSLYYDSLNKLGGIEIWTAVPTEGLMYPPPEYWSYVKMSPVKLLFDSNGNIININWVYNYSIDSYEDENGKIIKDLTLCCSGKYLFFKENGYLDLTDFFND